MREKIKMFKQKKQKKLTRSMNRKEGASTLPSPILDNTMNSDFKCTQRQVYATTILERAKQLKCTYASDIAPVWFDTVLRVLILRDLPTGSSGAQRRTRSANTTGYTRKSIQWQWNNVELERREIAGMRCTSKRSEHPARPRGQNLMRAENRPQHYERYDIKGDGKACME